VRYRINNFKIEKFVRNMLYEDFGMHVFVNAYLEYTDTVKLKVRIDDYEELMKNERLIKQKISNEFGIPVDRIKIYWDDEWRYNDW